MYLIENEHDNSRFNFSVHKGTNVKNRQKSTMLILQRKKNTLKTKRQRKRTAEGIFHFAQLLAKEDYKRCLQTCV